MQMLGDLLVRLARLSRELQQAAPEEDCDRTNSPMASESLCISCYRFLGYSIGHVGSRSLDLAQSLAVAAACGALLLRQSHHKMMHLRLNDLLAEARPTKSSCL